MSYTGSMEFGVDDLRQAVGRFRAAHAATYLARLKGEPSADPRLRADLAAPCQPERLQALQDLSRELAPEAHAALGGHVLRALVERAYADARRFQAEAACAETQAKGERRSLQAFWDDRGVWRGEAGLGQLREALRDAAGRLEAQVAPSRGKARRALQAALQEQSFGRHPDAGPEGGSRDMARVWLDASAEVGKEARSRCAGASGLEIRHEADLLAVLNGGALRAHVPPEGRAQRVGALWERLGLRTQLTSHARLGPAHRGLLPAAQVVVRSAPGKLVIVPSGLEAGLASELSLLEATGRALGYALVSPALPLELRHPTVASVARSLGGVALGMALHPRMWKQHYRASSAEAHVLAQHTACYLLCHSRLAAAAVLAAGQPEEACTSLAREALGTQVSPEVAGLLLARLSPGGSARALCAAPDVIAALRDAYDEDWYRNPQAAEPLRGAAARGGALSVEDFAQELGTRSGTGLALLAELF